MQQFSAVLLNDFIDIFIAHNTAFLICWKIELENNKTHLELQRFLIDFLLYLFKRLLIDIKYIMNIL